MSNVYHAALPTNVVAALQANGSTYAEVFIIKVDSHFVVETMGINYGSEYGRYKTINGAIKKAMQLLLPKNSGFGFYINPELINLLPQKWANAVTSPIIKFEGGKRYLDSEGMSHTITKRSENKNHYTRPPVVELFDSSQNENYAHYELIRYNNGVEICETKYFTEGSPLLSADKPR